MVDCRVQIKELLEQIVPVKMTRPDGDVELPLITYAEITNTTVEKWHDMMDYQVDVYAHTFREVMQIIKQVDEAMATLRATRTYVTPDTQARQDTYLYHKALNYRLHVNTYEMNFFGGN